MASPETQGAQELSLIMPLNNHQKSLPFSLEGRGRAVRQGYFRGRIMVTLSPLPRLVYGRECPRLIPYSLHIPLFIHPHFSAIFHEHKDN